MSYDHVVSINIDLENLLRVLYTYLYINQSVDIVLSPCTSCVYCCCVNLCFEYICLVKHSALSHKHVWKRGCYTGLQLTEPLDDLKYFHATSLNLHIKHFFTKALTAWLLL